MLVRISSVFVPYTQCAEHLEHVYGEVLPDLASAEGFICVWLLQRSLVGYSEFALVSLWQSEQAVTRYEASLDAASEGLGAIVRRTPPEIYNVLTTRLRKPTSDRDDGSCREQNEGAD
jgi:heme-degrading monooxygenase HmoA